VPTAMRRVKRCNAERGVMKRSYDTDDRKATYTIKNMKSLALSLASALVSGLDSAPSSIGALISLHKRTPNSSLAVLRHAASLVMGVRRTSTPRVFSLM